jgi:hypothetical protein
MLSVETTPTASKNKLVLKGSMGTGLALKSGFDKFFCACTPPGPLKLGYRVFWELLDDFLSQLLLISMCDYVNTPTS